MNFLRKLLNNKIGIAFAVVHWIFLFLAFGYLVSSFADARNPDIDLLAVLAIIIIVSDLPAIIPAAILWSPFYVFVEDKTVFWCGILFTSIFTITFQWLFVGQSIYNIFSRTESKLTSISLTDE